ncbi:ABC transporter ATP-binding protein [Mucilaginibacter antarcticus]|uniref:Polysaccharide ABC transporter ATP-binding protein n=1 Tax=Mucilaginibacter antarcticus TaxID=1855725 RepID=A0ABW5XMF1_9SPHI
MAETIIKVEHLGKSYKIGHKDKPASYDTIRDLASRSVKNFAKKAKGVFSGNDLVFGDNIEEFWALTDLNFEIKQGDTVGIIGRNGAGKSTFLKILSRITEPTKGRVTVKGRVASLMEVGTGFHPELSGRDNIFLNGAILGMTRAEIKLKFDEIVDFSGVEKFLDTPVKRYSSGMYVRLAFAVAAHLDSEILVVDEVLAVGDAEFQKKCLGKMDDISKGQGRTVLFVSHSIESIRKICRTGILLENGRSIIHSDIESTINKYFIQSESNKALSNFAMSGPLKDVFKVEKIFLNDEIFKNVVVPVNPDQDINIKVQISNNSDDQLLRLALAIDRDNVRVMTFHDNDIPQKVEKGIITREFKIPRFLLRPGLYYISLGGVDGYPASYFNAEQVAVISVNDEWTVGYEEIHAGIINSSYFK